MHTTTKRGLFGRPVGLGYVDGYLDGPAARLAVVGLVVAVAALVVFHGIEQDRIVVHEQAGIVSAIGDIPDATIVSVGSQRLKLSGVWQGQPGDRVKVQTMKSGSFRLCGADGACQLAT
jgi:hypothetical protein